MSSPWQSNYGWLCVMGNTLFIKNVYKTFEFHLENAEIYFDYEW